jgi:protein-tyrosine-phosphatase
MQITIGKTGAEMQIDFDAFTDAGKAYVIKYGLTQSLNDAHAAMKREDGQSEAAFFDAVQAVVDKKLAAIASGEVRVAGVAKMPRDPIAAEAQKIARSRVANAIKKNDQKVKSRVIEIMREHDLDEKEAVAMIVAFLAKRADIVALATENVAAIGEIDIGEI